MNKSDLVDQVAVAANVTKKEADAVVSAMLEVIVEAVSAEEKVTLLGFGSFESRQRQARTGRNPQTGEAVEIAASVVPAFSPGKVFKEKVAAR